MRGLTVLTEAFSMLGPASRESDRLRDFIERRGMPLWFLDEGSLERPFELMELYADHPMDLAGRGHRHYPMDIVPAVTGR